MLADIKAFMQKQPIANLQQIADAISVDVDTTRLMLQRWMRKGCVRCLSEQAQATPCGGGTCGSCSFGCHKSKAASELYCWE